MTRYEFESKLKDFLDNHLESYYFDTETFFEDGQGYVSTDANGKPHNCHEAGQLLMPWVAGH